MFEIEAVLLTGGAGRRMGAAKAGLAVDGVPMGERIARELSRACQRVTVLGRAPIAGCEFLPDEGEYQGPLHALARFEPSAPYVFLASCDLPRFQASVIEDLAGRIGEKDTAIPYYAERLQPLCALYRASAWTALKKLHAEGEKRLMVWVQALAAITVQAEGLTYPLAVANANTREELEALLRD